MEFASFGSRAAVHDMDGAKFFKLSRDTGLVTKGFTTIDVDLIFAKVILITHCKAAMKALGMQ